MIQIPATRSSFVVITNMAVDVSLAHGADVAPALGLTPNVLPGAELTAELSRETTSETVGAFTEEEPLFEARMAAAAFGLQRRSAARRAENVQHVGFAIRTEQIHGIYIEHGTTVRLSMAH